MKSKTVFDLMEKVFINGMIGCIIIGIIAGMIGIVISEVSETKKMLEFCHNEGYDGFKDVGGFGKDIYVCFKSIDGYEEQSKPIDLQSSEDEK